MLESSDWPIPYNLRRSLRAKRIHIRISAEKGLELIVPKRASKKQAIEFLNSKKQWVLKYKHLLKTNESEPLEYPQEIELRAINQLWQCHFLEDRNLQNIVLQQCSNQILLHGQIDTTAWIPVINRWLTQLANEYLSPKLVNLATQHQFSFNKLTFRNQKTMWGSCSHKNNISLNIKLLFLPADLVEYVMVHELCHTKHHNHSKSFWRLVECCLPNYRDLERALCEGGRYVPGWTKTLPSGKSQ